VLLCVAACCCVLLRVAVCCVLHVACCMLRVACCVVVCRGRKAEQNIRQYLVILSDLSDR
jgi:hypothetical protein